MNGLSYFLITRKLFDSPIWRDNPHILKLFIYLVGMARHNSKPKRFNGFEIKRGELLTSLSDISENNEYTERGRIKKWSRQRVSRMLQKLTENKYITLLADTYGTHIKVINYNTYQNPKIYKRTPAERVRNSCGMGADIYNKDKNVNNGNKKIYSDIINYLNKKAGKKFRATTKETKQHINARIRDGYSKEDFKIVIDNKCETWKANPKMYEYLRPKTLFGTNFESYLQNIPDIKPKTGYELNFDEKHKNPANKPI